MSRIFENDGVHGKRERLIADVPESSNIPEHRRHVWAEGDALVIGLFCGRRTLMALGEVDYGLMGFVSGSIMWSYDMV